MLPQMVWSSQPPDLMQSQSGMSSERLVICSAFILFLLITSLLLLILCCCCFIHYKMFLFHLLLTSRYNPSVSVHIRFLLFPVKSYRCWDWSVVFPPRNTWQTFRLTAPPGGQRGAVQAQFHHTRPLFCLVMQQTANRRRCSIFLSGSQ